MRVFILSGYLWWSILQWLFIEARNISLLHPRLSCMLFISSVCRLFILPSSTAEVYNNYIHDLNYTVPCSLMALWNINSSSFKSVPAITCHVSSTPGRVNSSLLLLQFLHWTIARAWRKAITGRKSEVKKAFIFIHLFIYFSLNSTYPKRNYKGVAEGTEVAGPDMIPPTWGLGIITMLTRQ